MKSTTLNFQIIKAITSRRVGCNYERTEDFKGGGHFVLQPKGESVRGEN